MDSLIRIGTVNDLPQVLNLIKDLAAFENEPYEVEVTIAEMQNWGFGKDKIFDFFVIEIDNKIIGLALYYFKYSTWKGKCLFLEDIIVKENVRNKGYGKKLFNAVVEVAKNTGVKRMEWQVLDWNKNAIEFYNKYQANLDSKWLNCKLNYSQLQSM
jgi:GNAT superfamily N-acetyltransferase